MATKAQMLTEAQTIKNETQVGANTANRVGSLFENIVKEELVAVDDTKAELAFSDDNDNLALAIIDGHVKSKSFDSENALQVSSEPCVSDLAFSDENGCDIVRFEGGHVKTKNFDSSNVLKKKGYQRLIRFSTQIDTNQPQDTSFSPVAFTTAQTPNTDTDNAVLYLPTTYTKDGEPTRLVIVGRQGGGTFTNVDDFLFSTNYLNIVPYLLYLGYAVMAVDGMPDTWGASLNLVEGYCNGTYVAVRSAREAYNYIIANYNIYDDGVFGIGYSQGGWAILNIADNSGIPFLAVCLKSPEISMRFQAWDSNASIVVGGETLSKRNRYQLCRVYNIASPTTDAELLAVDYNADKIAGFDPYTHGATDIYMDFVSPPIYKLPNDTSLDDITMKRPTKYAVKAWCAANDTTLSADVTRVFIKAIKNANCVSDLRYYATGSHALAPSNFSTLGTFVENGVTYNIYEPTLEMALWFYQFGGLKLT